MDGSLIWELSFPRQNLHLSSQQVISLRIIVYRIIIQANGGLIQGADNDNQPWAGLALSTRFISINNNASSVHLTQSRKDAA